MVEMSGQISVAIDNDAQLSIQGSTGCGHSFASLAGCLANSQSAIQLLVRYKEKEFNVDSKAE